MISVPFSFGTWFGFCLVAYIVHTLTHVMDLRGDDGPWVTRLERITFMASWLAWAGMLLSTQPGIPASEGGLMLFLMGAFQAAAGVGLIVVGLVENPRFNYRKSVITTGLYSRLLHPVYYGMILLLLGPPLVVSGLYALYSAPVWIGFILFYMITENNFLKLKLGGEYESARQGIVFQSGV